MQDKFSLWTEQEQQEGRRNRKERRLRRTETVWEDNLPEDAWTDEADEVEDLLRRKKVKAKPRREKMLDW